MTYRYEYNGNPDMVTVHVSFRLIDGGLVGGVCNEAKSQNEAELLALANGVQGAMHAHIWPYSVTVEWAAACERDTVLEGLRDIIVVWATSNGLMQPDEEQKQLPTMRADIKGMQCPECRRIQEEAMRGLAREFDRLDW